MALELKQGLNLGLKNEDGPGVETGAIATLLLGLTLNMGFKNSPLAPPLLWTLLTNVPNQFNKLLITAKTDIMPE